MSNNTQWSSNQHQLLTRLQQYFSIALCIALLNIPLANATTDDPETIKLSAALQTELQQLASIVKACVSRRDTRHPVFKGCIDWHSSVHGHWALLWAGHTLQDPALAQVALYHLAPDKLPLELRRFKKRDTHAARFEMPYGRAWFLQLVREAENHYELNRLGKLADHMFISLLEFARADGGSVLANDYQNASWYLYQLARWAQHTEQTAVYDEIKAIALQRLSGDLDWLPYADNTGFFDPKALAALLLGNIAPESKAWQTLVNNYADDDLNPHHPPFKTAHQGGLNYARSWGLWTLATITKQEKFAQAARQHQQVMLGDIANWRKDYQRFAHWVAQFGLLSHQIALPFAHEF